MEERVLQEVLSDVDGVLRRATGAVQEGACRCLVSLVLAGDTVADTVFKFCEGVYAGVLRLLPQVTAVRPLFVFFIRIFFGVFCSTRFAPNCRR